MGLGHYLNPAGSLQAGRAYGDQSPRGYCYFLHRPYKVNCSRSMWANKCNDPRLMTASLSEWGAMQHEIRRLKVKEPITK